MRWLVVAFILLIVIVSSKYGSQCSFSVESADWLDPEIKSVESYFEIKEKFELQDRLSLIIPTDYSFAELCKIQKFTSELPFRFVEIEKMDSPFELRRPTRTKTHLFYYKDLMEDCKFTEKDIKKLKRHPLISLFSGPKFKDIVIHISLKERESPGLFGRTDYKAVEKIKKHIKKHFPKSLFTGNLIFQSEVKKGLEWAKKLNFMVAILIWILLYLVFRSWTTGFLFISMVFLTTNIIKSGMHFFGHKIDPLSSALFLIMIVSLLEDFILVLYNSIRSQTSITDSIKKLKLPSFFTSLTTFFGFGSLYFSNNLSVKVFGLWTAIGSIIEWILMFLVFPFIVKSFPQIKIINVKNLNHISLLNPIMTFSPSKKWTWILITLAFAVPYGFLNVNLNYSPFEMFDSSNILNQSRLYFEDSRKYVGEVSLIYDSLDPSIINSISEDNFVEKSYFPQKIVNALTPGFPDSARDLVDYDMRSYGGLGSFKKDDESRAILFVKSYDLKSINQFEKRIYEICHPNCKIAGEIVATKDHTLELLNTIYISFIGALGLVSLIVLILTLFVGDKKQLVPALASTLWAPSLLILTIGLLDIQVNVVTCVAIALLIGLAGDSAIQFTLFEKRKNIFDGGDHLGFSTILTYLMIVAVSVTLLFSYFKSTQTLFGLIFLGLFYLLVGDLWILKGLRPRK